MQRLQNEIRTASARGEAVAQTAARLCAGLEALLPGAICAVVKAGDDGRYTDLAGPSLDQDYRRAFNGLAIGAGDDIFGHAHKPTDEATDIATDAAWRSYAHLPLELGLRACWARPVMSQDGRRLGGVCVYFRQPRHLSPSELGIVEAGVNLCALALERAQQAADLHRLAYRDFLTGLPNRAAFNAVSGRAGQARSDFGGLLLVDLDDIRRINITFGRQAGDRLIETAAARIASVASPLTVFRRGGDEFAVILPKGAAKAFTLHSLAQKILAAFGSPIDCSGVRTVLRATLGGAVIEDGAALEALEHRAVVALAHAKESHPGGFVAYSGDLGAKVERRIEVIRDMDRALSEDRIDAHYQPIIHLASGEVSGLEALFRLITPDGAAIPAGDYLEATSDPHTATRLTQRMLEIVARDIKAWREQGLPVKPVSVNLSSEDFRSGRVIEAVREIFGAEAVPLTQLILEVTESVYMGDDGAVASVLAELRALGVKVALDDFGTGFASLTHLLSVPVDWIKIDRSFIAQLTGRRRAAAVVEGLISMAGKLGATVVAEGVETSEQAAQLQAWGCEQAQGFLFSRALDRDRVVQLLLESPGEDSDAAFPSIPLTWPALSPAEAVSSQGQRPVVRYAVLLCGEDWRVVSERRQLGRFPNRRAALHCALALAREAAMSGTEIELLYSGPGGELRSYRLPSSWNVPSGPSDTPAEVHAPSQPTADGRTEPFVPAELTNVRVGDLKARRSVSS